MRIECLAPRQNTQYTKAFMRNNRVVFYLTDEEMRKFQNYMQTTRDFVAKSVNEAARFTVVKRIGGWTRSHAKAEK